MHIAHFRGVSLVDYPGRVASVIWTIGCNLRCPFCYNSELVLPEKAAWIRPLDPEWVLERLGERAGFVQGLVVTGGEPTLQPDLPGFLCRVKDIGLAVKLDTNGTQPEVVGRLLEEGLVDYIALDVKAPFERYGEYTGIEDAEWIVRAVRETVRILRERARDYELRTTVAPGLGEEEIADIAAEVGKERYVIQPFFLPEDKELVDPSWRSRPALSREEVGKLARKLGVKARA